MAMIVLSSPATLTGAGKKKTGPSRFIADFLTELARIIKIQNLDARKHSDYSHFTRSIHSVYTKNTLSEKAARTSQAWCGFPLQAHVLQGNIRIA